MEIIDLILEGKNLAGISEKRNYNANMIYGAVK